MSDKETPKQELETKCGASWQVEPVLGNTGYKVKCRHCGVILTSVGTPKCLLTKLKGE